MIILGPSQRPPTHNIEILIQPCYNYCHLRFKSRIVKTIGIDSANEGQSGSKHLEQLAFYFIHRVTFFRLASSFDFIVAGNGTLCKQNTTSWRPCIQIVVCATMHRLRAYFDTIQKVFFRVHLIPSAFSNYFLVDHFSSTKEGSNPRLQQIDQL